MKFSFSLNLTLTLCSLCPTAVYRTRGRWPQYLSLSLQLGTKANGSPGQVGGTAALWSSLPPFVGCQKVLLKLSFCGALKMNVVAYLGVQTF